MFIRKSRVLHCVLADEKYIHYLKTERISVILNEISRQPVRPCQEAKLRVLEAIRFGRYVLPFFCKRSDNFMMFI